MNSQGSDLKQQLQVLLEPSTTPEKALQFLSAPCLSIQPKNQKDEKPLKIFLANMEFIIKRSSDGVIDGIWEKIISKTFYYSRYFDKKYISFSLWNVHNGFSRSNIFTKWIYKVLNNPDHCPNPYIRLELLHLFRIFLDESIVSELGVNYKMGIINTMTQTIKAIEPVHLY